MPSELQEKLGRIRRMLAANNLDALHLAQAGNLAWLTGGGDFIVSFTNGAVAQAVVTATEVRLFAAEIERDRLEHEQVPDGIEVVYLPWTEPNAFDLAREALAATARTLSDSPIDGAVRRDLWGLRVPLTDEERGRYRRLGVDAAEAVGEAVRGLTPGLSEHQIAARVSHALRRRAIQPAVLLVGGDSRFKRFRHPIPSADTVHDRVMVVVCGRRHGLYANLTRVAAFTPLATHERDRYRQILEIESAALDATRHGIFGRDVLAALQRAYAEHGHPDAWRHHHQGGPCGYFTRDFLALPSGERLIVEGSAYAWNPSLPGTKVEDTVLLEGDALEVLTVDAEWPTVAIADRHRPDILALG